jgi:hypothetical protein
MYQDDPLSATISPVALERTQYHQRLPVIAGQIEARLQP